ncbi:MAG: hypothetical protein CL526_12590 [Aequorivita sp.]|nr:hypothetical protein [Aequorivita sp.]|tara:strand:- start:500 stop:1159 length:660 start_codon:yes stop_codon:yes gene_type:complete
MKQGKQRDFKGVWIPKELYLYTGLTWTQKLILLEVDSFTRNSLPCFVSNDHLSSFTQASISSVEKAVSKLVKEGYLERTRQRIDGKSTRFLRVNTSKFCEWQPVKDAKKNPQNLRSTYNNIPNQTNKTKKERTPVDITVVIEAFTAVGSSENEACKFYDYYSANGWTQGKNKPIVDWRAAARGWIRRAAEYNTKNLSNGFDPEKINRERLANYIKGGSM